MVAFKSLEQSGWTAKAAAYDQYFATIADQAIDPILDSIGDVAGRDVLDVCCGTVISLPRWRREADGLPAWILPRP